jgi:hypothetical protein
MLRRLHLVTLLAIAAVTGSSLAVVIAFRRPPAVWACERIQSSLRSGQPLTEVERLLGPSLALDTESTPDWLPQNAAGWPDGYHESDVFRYWTFGPLTVHIQFRDGHLVNYEPLRRASRSERWP